MANNTDGRASSRTTKAEASSASSAAISSRSTVEQGGSKLESGGTTFVQAIGDGSEITSGATETGQIRRDLNKKPFVVPWNDEVPSHMDPLLAAKGVSPSTLCALLMVRAALLKQEGFLALSLHPGAVSIVRVPDRMWGYDVLTAWCLVSETMKLSLVSASGDAIVDVVQRRISRSKSHAFEDDSGTPVEILAFEKSLNQIEAANAVRMAAQKGRAIHAFSPEPEAMLPTEVLLAEEQRLVVEPPDGEILSLLACCLSSIDGTPGEQGAKVPSAVQSPVGPLSPTLVDLAHRRGQTPAAFLERLAILLARQDALTPRKGGRAVVTLDDLPGLGDVGEWAQRAAADLRLYRDGRLAWSDMDRGVVLEGPPGTGKSTLALALANTAGVPFVSSSHAQWQGSRDGHLGSLLAAMRATFDEARRQAPCVLLLDEIDSFPARTSVKHSHRDYVLQVVNGLLEQLDGAVDRTGVLVIGTCNDASNLDPALTRAGRMERIIRLDRPDDVGLERIFRVHLGESLPDADLRPLARAARSRNAVGADVEHGCREARRRARTAGRPMLLDDLIAEVGQAPLTHGADAVWRMAIHEAGHVLACTVTDPLSLREVSVDPLVGGRSATVIDTFDLYRTIPHPTRVQARERLMVALAGRAAEEVVLGEPSGGSGGSVDSDLARATRMAALQVVSGGLDEHPEGLLFLGDANDQARLDHLLLQPEVRQRVAAVLRAGYEDALYLVRHRRPGLERVAQALVDRGSLSGQEARDLLGDMGPGEDAR